MLVGVIVLLVQILAVTLEKCRFINDLQIARFREIRLFAEPCHRRLGVLLPPFFAPKGRLPLFAITLCSAVEQAPAGGGQTVVKIEPANPEVIYVPAYNPTVVYGAWSYPAVKSGSSLLARVF
jgi:hypothetical protein